MTAKEKADEIYFLFGDSSQRVLDEIKTALYANNTFIPQYWYDVQEAFNSRIDSENESEVINH